MATRKVSTLSPVYYQFTIRQRAGLQIVDHALGFVAGQAGAAAGDPEALQACLDAGQILWQCRELILRAAEHRGPLPTIYAQALALTVAWRNPKAGIQ